MFIFTYACSDHSVHHLAVILDGDHHECQEVPWDSVNKL